jgi:hypothetical protein
MDIDEDPAPDTGELNSGMTLGSPLGDVNGSRADVVRALSGDTWRGRAEDVMATITRHQVRATFNAVQSPGQGCRKLFSRR